MIHQIIKHFLLATLLFHIQINSTFNYFKTISRSYDILSVRFSQDGKYLAYSQTQYGITILNISNNYAYINRTNYGFGLAYAMDYSNDQSWIAYCTYGSSGSSIVILNANDASITNQTIYISIDYILEIDFSADDQKIIACGNEGYAIYQVSTGNQLVNKTGISRACKFSINDQYAVQSDGTLKVYDQNDTLIYSYNPGGNGNIRAIDWNSNGTALAFLKNYKGLYVYNMINNSSSLFYGTNTSPLLSLDWSPDDRLIAFNIYVNRTVILNSETLKVQTNYNTPNDGIYHISFSPDNLYIAQAGYANRIIILQWKEFNCSIGSYKQNGTCILCKKGCLVCNSTICEFCSSGKVLGDGCTQVTGCVQLEPLYINISSNCIKCNQTLGFIYNASTKACQCSEGYSLNNNMCHNIFGCIGPVLNQSVIQCLTCDYSLKLQLKQNKCVCKKGYLMNDQTKKCVQICGDGIKYQLACDDGNTQNGDGCSSQCKVQSYYKCIDGSATLPSFCLLKIRNYFKLNLTRTDRKNMQNAGLFTFKLSPSHHLLSNATISQLTFTSSGILNVMHSFINGSLNIEVEYNQTLQRQQANISFNLNNVFINGPVFYNITFTVKTNNRELVYGEEKQKDLPLSQMQWGVIITYCIIVFMFTLLTSNHKMAGAQFINIYQTIIFIYLFQKKMTPLTSSLGLFTFFNIHFFNFSDDYDSWRGLFPSMIYYGIVILIFGILGIIYICRILLPRQITNTKIILYQKILFPLTLAFLYEVYSLSYAQNEYKSSLSAKAFVFATLIFKTIAILILVSQSREIFMKFSKEQRDLFGLRDCKKGYVAWYTSCYFATVKFIIIISSLYSIQLYREALAGFFLILFIIFIYVRPYKQRIHNITQITNMSVLILFISYIVLSHRMPQLASRIDSFSVLITCVIIGINIFVNIIRFVMILIKRCNDKKRQEAAFIKRKQREEQKAKKKNLHRYYYENSLLNTNEGLNQLGIINNTIKKKENIEHQKFIQSRKRLHRRYNKMLRQRLE